MTYNPIIVSSRISGDYGYVVAGDTSAFADNAASQIVEKYDNIANTWATKTTCTNSTNYTSGFQLNAYGYISGGYIAAVTNVTDRYNNILNTWTTKANLNTSRKSLSAYSLSNYGYTSGGYVAAVSAVTEKYDDVLNTWTAKANLNTARNSLTGFSLHGYGYTVGGYVAAVSAVTEKYDDVLNTWTAKTNLNTARQGLSCFNLNGYGYTSGGDTGAVSAVTEKYDDLNNTWTAKATLNTARKFVSAIHIDGYGYTVGGYIAAVSAVTEKYDDVLNTWTAKTSITTARYSSASFSLGSLQQSIQNPDIQEIIKHSIKEMIPADQTASRAIDGTVYTNTASSNLFVTVSARCIIDTAADVANIQAFSDTAADPTTAVTGKNGIEGGLAGEDVSVEISFIVRPYEKYKVVSTTSAGCTATLGKWFETILK